MNNYTLLMPFLAREEGYDLCLKVLTFYKGLGCDNCVLIALSGAQQDKIKFRQLLTENDLRVRIYEHEEESSDLLGIHILYEKMYRAAQTIDTDYVTIISGDDFTFPEVVERACCILDQDITISACAGRGILYNAVKGQAYIYPQTARLESDPLDRLLRYIHKPTALFYSTYRVLDLIDLLEQTTRFIGENLGLIRRNISFSEHIFSFFTILKGRLYIQDCLYFVRLQNLQQTGSKAPNLLWSYVVGDVDKFIASVSAVSNQAVQSISHAYHAYIYDRGANNPIYVLKNWRFIVSSPFRAINLLIRSWLRRLHVRRPNWALDELHKQDQESLNYQRVMGHLV